MYSRNRIYISEAEQEQMRNTKIVFGGLGLGSVIAECALRMGFETLHLIDGDTVELSNLNRQNYTQSDIGKPKCVALCERLKQINPNANITYANVFLTEENMTEHLAGADIAVNAIDFTSNAPLLFDEVCFEMNVPVVHPYNLGFGSLACVLTKDSANLKNLANTGKSTEISMVEHVLKTLKKKGVDMHALKKALAEYMAEQGTKPPPQLSVASWILGGLCSNIFWGILQNESLIVFPNFYYVDNNLNQFQL
jgi:molybdopterin/thiamine biosynthesis adenylyltransferase